jgi:hypothetical protein
MAVQPFIDPGVERERRKRRRGPHVYMRVGSFRESHVHRVGRVGAKPVVWLAVSSRTKPSSIRSIESTRASRSMYLELTPDLFS